MGYGFEVLNTFGEVTISSEMVVFQEMSSETISGTPAPPNAFYMEEFSWTNLNPMPFQYDVPTQYDFELVFVNLPAGHYLGLEYDNSLSQVNMTRARLISNLSSLSVKRFAPVSEIQLPSNEGYGLECYDAQGRVTFSSRANLLSCDLHICPPSGTVSIPASSDWFMISRAYYHDVGDRVLLSVIERPIASELKSKRITSGMAPYDTVYPNTPPEISVFAY